MKIALLHTVNATVLSLVPRIKQKLPDKTLLNFMDDSILTSLLAKEAGLEYCFEKMLCYCQFARRQGADVIMNCCSSMGAFSDWAKAKGFPQPVIRIDEPMADAALKKGKRIAVLATVETSLQPPIDMLLKKRPDCHAEAILVKGAAALNMSGKKAEHDAVIAKAAERIYNDFDAIMLSQGSMEDAVQFVVGKKDKILTSPALAIAHLAAVCATGRLSDDR